ESGTVVTLVLPDQRREVSRLMTVAGIRPTTTKIRPGDVELTRITGARTPSGVPITVAVPAPAAPAQADGEGGSAGKNSSPRRRSGKRSGLPTDVDMNGNPRRPRPK
ncbi:DEAD/DEAH box helicase, partial [Streptomyces sp. NRRL S-495]